MVRAFAVFLFCAVVAGCESDAAKLERLEREVVVARGLALAQEEELAEIRAAGLAPPAALDSIEAEMRSARTRATLAERELARFLR